MGWRKPPVFTSMYGGWGGDSSEMSQMLIGAEMTP